MIPKAIFLAAVAGLAVVEPAVVWAQSFPAHYLEPEPEHAIFPDRDALFDALWKATDARIPDGPSKGVYDPTPLAALMADEVEVFVASSEDPRDAEFRLIGTHPPLKALESLGRLLDGEHEDPVVMQRYGMRAVRDALRDRTIGRSDWLGGRICTAGYGKIGSNEFVDLVDGTGIAAKDWVIVQPERDPAIFPPEARPYLLVGMQDGGARNAGLWILRLPDGSSHPLIRLPFDNSVAPYLGQHACVDFANGWKLTAVAIRLD